MLSPLLCSKTLLCLFRAVCLPCVDVAPTFTDIASGAVPDDMDGVSLLPLLGPTTTPGACLAQSVSHRSGRLLLCSSFPIAACSRHGAGGSGGIAANWRTDFMVDYHGQGRKPCGLQLCPAPPADDFHVIDGFNNTYTCVRTLHVDGVGADSLYCEFVDNEHFVEFYDHKADPWQLKNLAQGEPPAIKPLAARLEQLRKCKGKECRPL